MKRIEVVAAVIRKGDEIFATQRGYGDYKDWWEFPGGKMEPGESPQEALRREIREELDAEIEVGRLIQTLEWDYPEFHLSMHCFWCSLASESMHLNEHEAARWLTRSSIHSVRWLPADEQILPRISVDRRLEEYVEAEIIPRYRQFDAAHREDHARTVIEQSLILSRFYDADPDMMYAIAAYHDTGLVEGRKTHHTASGRIIREDKRLLEWFSPEQIETIAQAAEDHRASSDHEPRSIYGRLVAEADRIIDGETIVRRTVQYGLDHYPELDKEGHWERTLEHLKEKYDYGGYLKLWIPESPNAARLEEFRQNMRDRSWLRRIFEENYKGL